MSTSIDNRVVSMRFDNEEFEKKATKSISTLDKLKSALNFSGATKDIDEVNKSFKEVDANPLLSAITGINSGFTSMIAKATIVNRMTNALIDSTKKFVESMSVNQVNAGWDKYADKTSAVQTIMAATAKDFNDTGKQMAYVNDQLDKLNWFTDETSYNFTDMVSNIGKFTSNGIKLDKSVTAMQGIATWAAVSGANANEASRAMYNLSQALAVGSVKLIDWKSIENANMATVEFKENAIETAVALGTLVKTGDGLYKTMKGNAVSVTNFNEALSDAWLTSDVLMQTLDKYGSFTDKLYEVSDATDKTATQLLSDIEKYQNGTLDLAAYAEECEMSIEDVTAMMEELSDETYALGMKSFKAAQEAKTFAEAINATTDAISTGWMKSFELIFGNYEEAKKLWTSVANIMYEVFAASGDIRNELLGEWKAGGGRKTFLEGINNAMEAILRIITPFKDAFREIFPEKTSEDLLNITNKFERFTKALQINSKQMTDLKKIARGVFSVVKLVLSTVSNLAHSVGNVLSPALGLVGTDFLDLLGYFGDFIYYCTQTADAAGFVSKAFNKVTTFAGKLVQILATMINQFRQSTIGQTTFSILTTVLKKAVDLSGKLVSYIGDVVSGLADLNSFSFSNILSVLNGSFDNVFGIDKDLEIEVKDSEGVLSGFQKSISDTCSNIGLSFKNLANRVSTAFEIIRTWLEDVPWAQLIAIGFGIAIIKTINNTVLQLTNLTNAIKNLTQGFTGIVGSLDKVCTSIAGTFNALTNSIKTPNYLKVAQAIALVAASVFALSLVDTTKLWNAVGALTATLIVFGVLTVAFAHLPVLAGAAYAAVMTLSKVILVLAAGLMLMAKAFNTLQEIDIDSLIGSVVVFGTMIAGLTYAAYLMNGNITRLSDASGKILSSNTAAKNILAMSASIYIIAKAIKSIADIKIEDPASALTAVAAAVGSIIAITLSLSKIKGTNGIAGASALLMTSITLMASMKVVKQLCDLKWEKLKVGLGNALGFIGILATFFVATRFVGQNAWQAGVAFAGVGVAIYLIIGAIGVLGVINENVLKKGINAIGYITIIFIALMTASNLVGQNAHKISVTLLAAAAAMAVIGVIAAIMGSIKTETLIKGVAAVGAISMMFAILMVATGHAKSLGKDITLLTTMLVAVGAMIAAMTLVGDTEGIKAAGIAIAAVMSAMSTILAASSIAKCSLQVAGILALALVAMMAIGKFMSYLSNNLENPQNAITAGLGLAEFCGVFVTVATAMAGIAKLSSLVPWGGIGKMAVVAVVALTAIGLILAVIGSLNISKDLAEKCLTVGEAVGNLVGGLVGGLAGGAMAALGNGLNAFNNAISGVDFEKVKTGMNCLIDAAKAIAALVAVGFIASLSALTSAAALIAFPLQMMFFGNALRNFSEALGNADIGRIQNAIPAVESLVTIANMLPRSGGLFSIFFGQKSFATFGVQLGLFGYALQTFSKSLGNANIQNITDSLPAVRALVEIGNELPKSPSLFSYLFTGARDFGTFGTQLTNFGIAMRRYSESIKGIDYTTLWHSISGARALVEIANELPKMFPEHGLIAVITGQNTLGTFGDTLEDFGNAMAKYYTSLAQIRSFKADNTGKVIETARSLIAFLPEAEGVKVSVLTDFSDKLVDFAKDFSTFFVSISEVKESALLGPIVASIYESMVKIRGHIESFRTAGNDCVEGLIEGLSNSDTLSRLQAAGENIATTFLDAFRNKSTWGSPWACMIDAGEDAALGLWQGASKSSDAKNAGAFLGNEFLDGFRVPTGWGSPWESMITAIKDCVGGIWQGITENKSKIEEAGGVVGQTLADGTVITAENGITSGLSALWKKVTSDDEYSWLNEMADQEKNKLLGSMALDTDDVSDIASEQAKQMEEAMESAFTPAMTSAGTTAADAFLTALEDRIEDYDLDINTIDLEQELWEATIGKNATQSEITARETANLTAKIALQNEKVQAANEKYEYTMKKFGETSQDAKKAYQELLQEQISLASLMETLNETNSTASNNSAEAMAAYAKWVGESQDQLLALGFTMEEISAAAQQATGYNLSGTQDTMQNSVSDAVTNAMGTVATTYANTAESTLGALTSNFSDYGTTYATAIGTGMASSSYAVANGANADVSAAATAFSNASAQWYTLGQNASEGFKNGILSKIDEIASAAAAVANAAFAAAQIAIDSHSPSRKFMWLGEMADMGFIAGFESLKSNVSDSAAGVSEGAINAARTTIEQIADILGTDGALNPEITPILDLSQVRSGMKNVSANMSGIATINARASNLQVNSVASSIGSKQSNINQTGAQSGQNGSQSFSFVQNNYSPKALSRAEIYRNTNNQFSAFKEAVSKA